VTGCGPSPRDAPSNAGSAMLSTGSDLDGVSVEISDVCVVHAWCVFASIEEATAGTLHSLNRGIDTVGGAIGQVDAEVLPATLLANSLTLLIGRREMQRE
jgi:hypothetical protein